MPGPGPQPPSEGPFFVLFTLTARDTQSLEDLATIFESQRQDVLSAGAKVYSVGKSISRSRVSVYEQYDDDASFHLVHSPVEKSQTYMDTRAKVFALKETMEIEIFKIA